MHTSLAVGDRVVTRANVQMQRLAPDFPGWDAPNYRDFLGDVLPNTTGRVIAVHHHGSAPYTRYVVRLSDCSTLIDAVHGRDFNAVQPR